MQGRPAKRRPIQRRTVPSPFLRLLTILLLAIAVPGGVLAASGTASGAETEAKAGKPYSFDALGASWVVHQIIWTPYDKQWLVGAVVVPVRSSGRSITGPELIASLCREIVAAKPQEPAAKIAAKDIFRVDLIVGGPNGQPLWPIPVPVQVSGGDCQVRGDTQSFFVRYPGAMAGWRLVGGTLQKNGDKYRHQMVFEPDAGAPVRLGDFDFDLACRATLKDPTVQTIQASDAKRHPDFAIEPDTVLIVAKQPGKKGVFIGNVYSTANGKCVHLK